MNLPLIPVRWRRRAAISFAACAVLEVAIVAPFVAPMFAAQAPAWRDAGAAWAGAGEAFLTVCGLLGRLIMGAL